MAEYTFKCSLCNFKFSRIYSFNDDKSPKCPECGCNRIFRVFDSNPIIFNCSGFYVKDK